MRHVAMYDFDVIPVNEEKCERTQVERTEEIELVRKEFFERTNRIISAKYPDSEFYQNPSHFAIEEDEEQEQLLDFFYVLDKQSYVHRGASGITYKITLHIAFLF